MKYNNVHEPMNITGADQIESFNIKASAKAFSTLMDTLYSDKVRAIIRELMCNARDSHVEAGKANVPILLQLPNSFDQTFMVRDYGLGMSHEDVMTIFRTFFESTKETSNDVTGMLGLGSKSPLAYADTITVESIHDGVKRIYSQFKDSGEPKIALLHTEDTDECNGMAISFYVPESDFILFQQKAKRVLLFFDCEVDLRGCNDFEIPKMEYSLKEDNWGIYNDTPYSSGIVAVQGNVAYPIDMESLRGRVKDKIRVNKHDIDPDSIIESLDGINLRIDFNIGELGVAPSRESLSYDNRTIRNVYKRLQTVLSRLIVDFQEEMDEKETYWDACRFYYEKSEMDKRIEKIVKGAGITYKGRQLKKNFEFANGMFPWKQSVVDFRFYYENRDYASRVKLADFETGITINCKWDVIIAVDDVGRGSITKVRWNIREGNFKYIILVKPLYEDRRGFEEEVEKISDAFGNMPMMKVSELPKKPRKSSGKLKRQREKAYGRVYNPILVNSRYDKVLQGYYWSNLQEVDIDKMRGGVYVEIRHTRLVNPLKGDNEHTASEMAEIVRSFRREKLLHPGSKIFGFTSRDVKKVRKLDNWINLFDLIERTIKKYDTPDRKDMLRKSLESQYVSSRMPNSVKQVMKYVKKDARFDENHLLWVDVEEECETDKVTQALLRVERQFKRISNMELDIYKTTGYEDDDLITNICNRYPVIVKMGYWNLDQDHNLLRDILDYIEMVDLKKE